MPNVYGGMVSVRLVMNGLKQQVEAVLPTFADDLRATIQHEVDQAIKAFDFRKEVANVTNEILRESIRRSIRSAVDDCRFDAEFTDMVKEQAKKALLQAFGGL